MRSFVKPKAKSWGLMSKLGNIIPSWKCGEGMLSSTLSWAAFINKVAQLSLLSDWGTAVAAAWF